MTVRKKVVRKTPLWLMLVITAASVLTFTFLLGLTAFVTRDRADVRVLQLADADTEPEETVVPKARRYRRTTVSDDVVLGIVEPRRESLQDCFGKARVTDLSAPLDARLRLRVRTAVSSARILEVKSLGRLPMGLSACLRRTLVDEAVDTNDAEEEEGVRIMYLQSVDKVLQVVLEGTK